MAFFLLIVLREELVLLLFLGADVGRVTLLSVSLFLDGVNLGFDSDAQAIEAALGCAQCSAILCTGKVIQRGLMHKLLDIFKGSLSRCQLEHLLLGEGSTTPHRAMPLMPQ